MAKNKIILFGDYTCPYCYLASNILKEIKHFYDIEIVHIFVEIDKNLDKYSVLLDEYYELRGIDSNALYDDIKEIAQNLNIDINKPTYKYNTNLTILLGEFARDNELNEEYSNIVYEKYFSEDEDISSEEVISEIFDELDLDYKEGFLRAYDGAYKSRLKEYEELLKSYDLEVVPSFIINDEIILSNTLKLEIIEKYLHL